MSDYSSRWKRRQGVGVGRACKGREGTVSDYFSRT